MGCGKMPKLLEVPKQFEYRKSMSELKLGRKSRLGIVNEHLNLPYREAITAVITAKKKTPEDIENILKTLRTHFIFKNLDKDSQMSILEHVKHYSIGPKEIVFRQGDPGVSFFCVEKGRLEVLCNGAKTIILPGSGFGELALLDDRPRTATVKTIEACTLWGIDRKSFNSAVKKINEMSYQENKKFINTIPLFDPLTSNQKELMLSALVTQKWTCGQAIIREGESGDLLYIIKEGLALCYENIIEKRQLTKGEYFGEQALLHQSPRTATIIAGTDLTLVSIGRETLIQVLGDKLECILYRNSQLMAIDKSSFLRSLSPSQVELLLKCSTIKKYKAGEIVISSETKKSHKFVMVLKGSIRGPTNDIGIHECIGDKEIADKDNSSYMIDYIANVDTYVAEVILSELELAIGGEINQVTVNNEANLILIKVNLFKGLSNEKAVLLAKALRITHNEDGDVIIDQGTPAESFYIIKSGMVKVYKKNSYIRDVSKYDYFGERAILFNDIRSATVIAKGSVECWMFSKQDFMEIIDESIKEELLKRIELQDSTAILHDLIPIKLIGKGMYGNVTLVTHKAKNSLYALKTISKDKIISFNIYDHLILEKQILMQLNHSMIIKLIKTFKDWNRIYFLMEYIKGSDLFDVLIDMQIVREESAKFYMACLLIIVDYLHDRHIVHRDLKPENIMIDEEGYLKLIDFDTAKIINGRTYTTVGTPHYMAPEIILRDGYNSAVDLWSLGIIMYEIIYGKVPFGNDEEDPTIIYEEILEHKLDIKGSPYNGNAYKSFIQQLLNPNPAARLGGSMEKLKSHSWFSNFNWNRLISRSVKPPYIPGTQDINDCIPITDKTIQEFILEIEVPQIHTMRKASLEEPPKWDDEF
jgi:cGMP-dependent protein kinase 1